MTYRSKCGVTIAQQRSEERCKPCFMRGRCVIDVAVLKQSRSSRR